MNKWLPLEKAVLKAVICMLPSPKAAQKERLSTICRKFYKIRKSSKLDEHDQDDFMKLKEAVETCKNTEDAPIVVYVSKMVATTKENINERGLSKRNWSNAPRRKG
jgi:translation elongation factor EF-G